MLCTIYQNFVVLVLNAILQQATAEGHRTLFAHTRNSRLVLPHRMPLLHKATPVLSLSTILLALHPC